MGRGRRPGGVRRDIVESLNDSRRKESGAMALEAAVLSDTEGRHSSAVHPLRLVEWRAATMA